MPEPVIVADNVRKSYGNLTAVDGVSLSIERGEVYGLLGHNGAGKTTMVEMLEGHRTPTSGSVSVLGYTPANLDHGFRDRIGIVLQSMSTERFLTVREMLQTFADVYSNPRPVDEVLDLVGLTEKAGARVRSLSGGQQRRVDLALGIVGNPEVLFLDEPTTGFDPVARRQSWDLVQRLCDGGTTVLLTTHYLDEAEHLADRVGVLAGGALVAEGTPAELIASVPATKISFRIPDGTAAGSLHLPAGAAVDDGSVRFSSEHPTSDLAAITTAAVEQGVELEELRVHRPTLEDVFLDLGDTPDGATADPGHAAGLPDDESVADIEARAEVERR